MTNPMPSERYVLFLDLLGFRNVVNGWEANGRKAQLVELVRWISTAQSAYAARATGGAASVSYSIIPAITTFSDCVVISFPVTPPANEATAEFDHVVLNIWKSEVLKHMAILAARIAARAIRLQLLLRGGMCRGQLVHEGGEYIIGPGLNEAYRLETKVADVPRIVVSKDIYSNSPEFFPSLLRQDADGLAFLDYMPQLVEEIQSRSDAAAWRECRMQDIESNIATATGPPWRVCFWRKRPASIREKWQWFRAYFYEGTLGLAG
jgi:class 3 adenylate cyclase